LEGFAEGIAPELVSMILRSVKRRLGFVLVIAAAALGTAVVTGNAIVVAIAAVAAALVLGALPAGSRGRSPDDDRQKRAPGEPFTASYRWKGDRVPDLKDLSQALNREGLRLSEDSHVPAKVVLSGGSQLCTRLFGGYFVNPSRLPIRVELKAAGAAGNGSSILELGVRDRLGIAVRDEALEDRYVQAATNIRSAVETQLKAMGTFEIDD
jgi:hypothetical protein